MSGLTGDEREALLREIGPPTERDRNWQPMVSAYEVRALLDTIDAVEALADEWEARCPGNPHRLCKAGQLRAALGTAAQDGEVGAE